MTEVRVFVDGRADVGEGPVWQPEDTTLLWIDMTAGDIHRSTYSDGSTTTRHVAEFIGAVAPRQRGGFVIGTRSGFALLDDIGGIEAEISVLRPGTRMNDAKCDPQGRFWSGSTADDFAPGLGGMHVLHADRTVTTVATGLTLPNGMDWSPAGDTYYLADSVAHELLAFDVDLETATLSNRRVLHAFEEGDGMPDGLCVDAFGRLWVAMWGGSAVVCVSPDGERLLTVPIPATQPSSCAFGGDSLATLFVTSAASALAADPGRRDGSVFALTGLDAVGLLSTSFAG